MHGSDRVPDLRRLRASLGWTRQTIARAKCRSSPSVCSGVLGKCLTPPTLSETRFFAHYRVDYEPRSAKITDTMELAVQIVRFVENLCQQFCKAARHAPLTYLFQCTLIVQGTAFGPSTETF